MGLYRRYSVLIGIYLLTCVVILLLSSPGSFLSRQVSFISTGLYGTSGSDMNVKTKMDFGNAEHMKSFPMLIAGWEGFEYDVTEVQEALGANFLLMRAYVKPALGQPVFFTILQAETEPSFRLPICYRSQGYEIDEESQDTVPIFDTGWDEEDAPEEIVVNKLWAHKEQDDVVTERQLAIYFYVRGNRFASDMITMVEVSAYTPIDGSYDSILGEMKEFVRLALPYMFEPAKNGGGSTLLGRLLDHGVIGYVVVIVVVALPVAIAAYPYIERRRRSKNTTARPEG